MIKMLGCLLVTFWDVCSHHLAPALPPQPRYGKHVRNAFIGFTSSVVADTLCNPIRVLKVNKQTSLTRTGLSDASSTQQGTAGRRGAGRVGASGAEDF